MVELKGSRFKQERWEKVETKGESKDIKKI